MEIEKFKIYGSRKPLSAELIDEHKKLITESDEKWREFKSEEIQPITTYAVQYFINAVQELLYKNMCSASAPSIDISLDSGWRVRTLDLGLHWKRYIELIDIYDAEKGFILEGELECDEKSNEIDDDLSIEGRMDSIIHELKASELIVENNEITDVYNPENSTRFTKISVYPYHMQDGAFYSREKIIQNLIAGQYTSETFEHYPHYMMDYDSFPEEIRGHYAMVSIESTGRSVTPGEVMRVLPIVSEFLSVVDENALTEAYEKYADSIHYTLQKELLPLLKAARQCLDTATTIFPPAPFVSLFNNLWKQAICTDVLNFLTQINEATEELIEHGHSSSDNRFFCNDDRTQVYAKMEGEVQKTFVRYSSEGIDRFGLCISINDGHVVVSTADYFEGIEKNSLIDFDAKDGSITNINKVEQYNDTIAGMLRVMLVDISSVHCYLVSDPEPSAPSPLRMGQ